MAIKTIRKGRIPPDPVLEGTCSHCRWMGECGIADAKQVCDPRDQVPDYWIDCPTCNRRVVMREKKPEKPSTGDGCCARDNYL